MDIHAYNITCVFAKRETQREKEREREREREREAEREKERDWHIKKDR